jgi:peroxiredoxin family protein
VNVAAVLATREPERLYAGLSVLVSSAADGEQCAALASFGSLELLFDPRIDGPLAPSLAELVDTALELDNLTVHACSAAMQTLGIEPAALTERGLDGVKSTPRFLRDTAGARLLFV